MNKVFKRYHFFRKGIQSYSMLKSPNGSAGRCFTGGSMFFGAIPLTCTIFDPSLNLENGKTGLVQISPTNQKHALGLFTCERLIKISHRGTRIVTGVIDSRIPPDYKKEAIFIFLSQNRQQQMNWVH